MKNMLLTLVTIITTVAAGTSIYLASLPNLTDSQKALSSTANTITIAGTTTIFGLLNDDDSKEDKDS